MSQVAALREIDAMIVEDLVRAGLGDAATYTAPTPGAQPVACDVLVDRAAQFYDDANGVAGYRTTVMLFLQQIAAPARLGVVTVGSETFTLDQLDARDESMARWVVVHG